MLLLSVTETLYGATTMNDLDLVPCKGCAEIYQFQELMDGLCCRCVEEWAKETIRLNPDYVPDRKSDRR